MILLIQCWWQYWLLAVNTTGSALLPSGYQEDIFGAFSPSQCLLFISLVPLCYLVNDWMSLEYLIQSHYWPKYHFQHPPSVQSSVNSSLTVSLSYASLKFHTCLCSALCSFHLKYQEEHPVSRGWFLLLHTHTPPHPWCHLIDSEQRKQLSDSASGAQLHLSSKLHHEFPVTVRARSFLSHCG